METISSDYCVCICLCVQLCTCVHCKITYAGRMHNACISEIDTDKRIVSVEWTEGKDTKGKEACIYTCKFIIKQLNVFAIG